MKIFRRFLFLLSGLAVFAPGARATTYDFSGSFSTVISPGTFTGGNPKSAQRINGTPLTVTYSDLTIAGTEDAGSFRFPILQLETGPLLSLDGNDSSVARSITFSKTNSATFTPNSAKITLSGVSLSGTTTLTLTAFSGATQVGTQSYTGLAYHAVTQVDFSLLTGFTNITSLKVQTGKFVLVVQDLVMDAVTNNPPTISDVTDKSTSVGVATSAIPVTVGDTETAVASLSLTGSSSNTTLVPNANIVFGGSGASRTVTVTPAAGQTGTSTITLTVTDGGSLTATDTFVLTVSDTTKPTVASVVRLTPSTQPLTTATPSVTFRVTYSEAVTGVVAANFQIENFNGGTITGTVGTPTGGTTVYDVPVTLIGGSGEFRLKVVN